MSNSKSLELTNSVIAQGLLNFFATSGGGISPVIPGASSQNRQPGLDVYMANTQDRMPQLHQQGQRLGAGVKRTASISVLADDGSGNMGRVAVDSGQVLDEQAGRGQWWSVCLVEYDSPARAQAAMVAGKENTLPTASVNELIAYAEESKNPTAKAALEALVNQERKSGGFAGFQQSTKLFPNPANLVILASPSGSEKDGVTLWYNRTRGARRSNTTQNTQPTQGMSADGGEVAI